MFCRPTPECGKSARHVVLFAPSHRKSTIVRRGRPWGGTLPAVLALLGMARSFFVVVMVGVVVFVALLAMMVG